MHAPPLLATLHTGLAVFSSQAGREWKGLGVARGKGHARKTEKKTASHLPRTPLTDGRGEGPPPLLSVCSPHATSLSPSAQTSCPTSPTTTAAAAYTHALATILVEAGAALAGHGSGAGGGGGGGGGGAAPSSLPLGPATPFTDAGLDSLDMLRVSRGGEGRGRRRRKHAQKKHHHHAGRPPSLLPHPHPHLQVAAALSAALGLRLPATALFDNPTPASLAASILELGGGGDTPPASASTTATPTPLGPPPPPPRRTSFADLFGGPARARPTLGDVLGRRLSRASVLRSLVASPLPPPPLSRVWIAGASLRSPAGEAGRALETGEAAAPVPHTRWEVDAGRGAAHPPSTRFGAFLRGVTFFDPVAFGMTPAEAGAADPQQRLLLEAAADLLVGGDGRTTPAATAASLRRPASVFVGISYADAALLSAERDGHAGRAGGDPAARAAASLSRR